jgi:hypothetical protein
VSAQVGEKILIKSSPSLQSSWGQKYTLVEKKIEMPELQNADRTEVMREKVNLMDPPQTWSDMCRYFDHVVKLMVQ